MPKKSSRDITSDSHEFFTQLLRDVREVVEKEYGLHNVSIRPIKADGTRLSTPVRIEGTNKKQKKELYFGKIISNSNFLTFRSIQVLKNLYLQLRGEEPLFKIFKSPEEIANAQYNQLVEIHKRKIPTAKPFGCHQLQGMRWLLVEEFIKAKPLSTMKTITVNQMDTVFCYLRLLHKKKIFHGDLKPDNILIGDRIYILDVGGLRKDVSSVKKQAYDLASVMCSFLAYHSAEDIVNIVRKHYSNTTVHEASEYIDLVQLRPDIHFNNAMKQQLLVALNRTKEDT